MMFSRNKTPATTWNASMVINGSLRRTAEKSSYRNRERVKSANRRDGVCGQVHASGDAGDGK